MRNAVCLLLLSFPLFSACNKDPEKTLPEYECSQSVNYDIITGVVFNGYTVDELTEVIVDRYRGGTDFSELISRDTIRSSQIILKDSLAFLKVDTGIYSGFWTLEDQVDYRVTVPATQEHFVISGTMKGPDERTWIQSRPCQVKTSLITTLGNIHIDGVSVYPLPGMDLAEGNFYSYYIALKNNR